MRFALIAFACLCSSHAAAQVCSELETPGQRSKAIAEAHSTLARSVDRIEVPPPDVARYIETENSAALRQRSLQRLSILMANPFYHPAEVAKHYAIVRQNLDAAHRAKLVADQVVYLSVVIAEYADLSVALSDYHQFDLARPQQVISKQGVREEAFDLTVSKSDLLRVLQCGVRQMREPN
ncbi:hypothetical protein ACRBEV_10115 [Methylobacterium phyllosphaerae]